MFVAGGRSPFSFFLVFFVARTLALHAPPLFRMFSFSLFLSVMVFMFVGCIIGILLGGVRVFEGKRHGRLHEQFKADIVRKALSKIENQFPDQYKRASKVLRGWLSMRSSVSPGFNGSTNLQIYRDIGIDQRFRLCFTTTGDGRRRPWTVQDVHHAIDGALCLPGNVHTVLPRKTTRDMAQALAQSRARRKGTRPRHSRGGDCADGRAPHPHAAGLEDCRARGEDKEVPFPHYERFTWPPVVAGCDSGG